MLVFLLWMAAFDHKIIEKSFPDSIAGTWKRSKTAHLSACMSVIYLLQCRRHQEGGERLWMSDSTFILFSFLFCWNSLKQYFLCSFSLTSLNIILEYTEFPELLLFSKGKKINQKLRGERGKSNSAFDYMDMALENNFQRPNFKSLTLCKNFN